MSMTLLGRILIHFDKNWDWNNSEFEEIFN